MNWIDYTRRNDPAQRYYVDKLRRMLDKHGYPKVLCFWTKAPATVAKLYRSLIDEMKANDTLVLAQVTWNNYGPEMEPGVTPARAEIKPLVELLGPAAVRVRFDPIIIGFTTREHLDACLATCVDSGISRIITNFLVPEYKGVGKLLRQMGYDIKSPDRGRKIITLQWMVNIAADVGIEIAGCAELYISGVAQEVEGLVISGCADPEWAQSLKPGLSFTHRPSRPGCLCVYDGDWGEYSSRGGPQCPHQCVYCYAK